ncbi:MAG: serine hydrolase domain-containing protein [Bacteroidota bacterium]
MKKVILLACCLLSSLLSAQLSNEDEQALDSVFTQWNQLEKPGMAGGLIYGTNVQYLKGFGIANLESKTRITPTTQFHVDHLSQQFTILAVLLLENQGKLALSDAVQKFVPKLPKYEKRLTVGHLVNHCSGLDDYEMMKAILGKTDEDVFTHQDALRMIQQQTTTRFDPGTKFSYILSKTELSLLAEVIAKASGQSFSEYTKTNIFDALGMQHSKFVEDHNQLVFGGAGSYQLDEEVYKKEVQNLGNAGPNNLWTCAADLMTWYKILTLPSDHPLADPIKKLDTSVKLDDGSTYDSSWGRMTLGRSFFHKERGLPAYWQYGLAGSYGSNVFRFPEQQLTSFVLGNNDAYNGMPAMMMAYHYVEDVFPETQEVTIKNKKKGKISAKQLQTWAGSYWNKERGIARRVFFERDTLFYGRIDQERGRPLIPLQEKNRFQLLVDSDDIIKFTFRNENGVNYYDSTFGDSDPVHYQRFTPYEPDGNALQEYSGNFYSPELNSVYQFKTENKQLVAKGPEGTKVTFFPVTKDVFRSDTFAWGSILFQRDTDGKLSGLHIMTDGIQGLEFFKFSYPKDEANNAFVP